MPRDAGGDDADDPIAILRRWEAHGATWRVKAVGGGEAVVELCTCYGEPVDELRSRDAAFVAHVARARAAGQPPAAERVGRGE